MITRLDRQRDDPAGDPSRSMTTGLLALLAVLSLLSADLALSVLPLDVCLRSLALLLAVDLLDPSTWILRLGSFGSSFPLSAPPRSPRRSP